MKVPPTPKSIAPATPPQVKKLEKKLGELQHTVLSIQKINSKDTKLDKLVTENVVLKEEVKSVKREKNSCKHS